MTAQPRSIFVGHGAPTLATSSHPATDFLRELGARIGKPRAVIFASPHRQGTSFDAGAAPAFSAWHDFGGFPRELYEIQYSPHGDPALAARVSQVLVEAGLPSRLSADARVDHGIWVPLRLMWPDADVPVMPVAQLGSGTEAHYRLGQALAPLAAEGYLVIGSGSITHNLADLDRGNEFAAPQPWAREFDDWIASRIETGAIDELLDYRKLAPHALRAHPTEDHLMPLFVALGAGGAGTALYRGFSYATISMSGYGFA